MMTEEELAKAAAAGSIVEHLHPDSQIAVHYLIEHAKIEERNRIVTMLKEDYKLGIADERERVIKALANNCNIYHTALVGCECSVQIEIIEND
jgi:hypothetical protein